MTSRRTESIEHLRRQDAAAAREINKLVTRTQLRADPQNETSVRDSLVDVLDGLDPDAVPASWRDGVDVVGAAYMKLLRRAQRRPRGQVYTPMWAARVMAAWAVPTAAGTVLDPGCGSGVLLIAAAERRGDRSTRLIGIDLDPLAVQMAHTNLRIRNLPNVDVSVANFLTDNLDVQPTGVVCNPPYTRHHDLTQAEKEQIVSTLGARFELPHVRQASLHVLFLVRALEVAAPGARVAFLTPAHWLDTRYGQDISVHIRSRAQINAVVELGPRYFPEAQTSAAITLLTNSPADSQNVARLKLSHPLPPPEQVIQVLNETPPRNPAVRRGGVTSKRYRSSAVSLGTLARVHRGIATGHNKFFVLSDEDRRQWGLSSGYLHACITSPRVFDGNVLTEEMLAALGPSTPRWLLVSKRPHREGPLARYLAYGRSIGADDRALSRQRHQWFALKWRGSFPILFSYLNKRNPRFVWNEAEALPLNNWLVVEPVDRVDSRHLFELLSSKTFGAQLSDRARHYGNGLWKLEPSELEQISVPGGRELV